MGFLDKVKSSAAEATAKVKDSAGDVQTKREIGKTYDELGKKAYELSKSGALSHPDITQLVSEIDRLKDKLEGDDTEGTEAAAETPAPAPAAPAASEPPPPPAPPV